MIKAVIFDLDGTILYTLSDLANAMNKMLAEFGYPVHTDLNVHRLAIGTGARNYVKKCLPEAVQSDDAQVDICLEAYRRIYDGAASVETKPYDGIDKVMTYLRENNIAINVLSNKPDSPTKALVEQWFSAFSPKYVYGERVGVKRKPDPEAPLEIAKSLGISPSEVAFVGDSDVDIKTGVNAGMIPVGVLWGYRDRELLEECGAKYLANTPEELIHIFKQLA